MKLFVDTSVWSLALRRGVPSRSRELAVLAQALDEGASIFTTGLVLQELLQGFHGPRASTEIVKRFSALPFIVPATEDHVAAASLRNACERKGIQIGTIDALLSSLCIRHELSMLTTEADFALVARHSTLRIA